MQQKNVKHKIKPKLAVCLKTAARSKKLKISRECFFVPNLPKMSFGVGISKI